jgi:hypothetical protein
MAGDLVGPADRNVAAAALPEQELEQALGVNQRQRRLRMTRAEYAAVVP